MQAAAAFGQQVCPAVTDALRTAIERGFLDVPPEDATRIARAALDRHDNRASPRDRGEDAVGDFTDALPHF